MVEWLPHTCLWMYLPIHTLIPMLIHLTSVGKRDPWSKYWDSFFSQIPFVQWGIQSRQKAILPSNTLYTKGRILIHHVYAVPWHRYYLLLQYDNRILKNHGNNICVSGSYVIFGSSNAFFNPVLTYCEFDTNKRSVKFQLQENCIQERYFIMMFIKFHPPCSKFNMLRPSVPSTNCSF